MLLLQANQITKSYGSEQVLSNVSMQINKQERIGLVGVNGAGKSTFLQIIAGEMSFDQGELHRAKELKIGYLAQNTGLESESTIWEEMLDVFSLELALERQLRELEVQMSETETMDSKEQEALLHKYDHLMERFRQLGGYEIETKIRSILQGMGFDESWHSTMIQTLSGGQKTRLALARLLLTEPDLLLLDEPTNHLDLDTLSWLEDYLRHYNGALVVVSHDRFFLDQVAESIVEIERHRTKKYTGNYTRFVDTKAKEAEAEWKQYEQQQQEITRMEEFVQRNIARASTTNRAKSRRKALERMDRMDRPLGTLKRASFSFETERSTGKDVLEVTDVSFQYDEEGEEPILQQLSFQLKKGEAVALIGPNGAGKSTLFRLLTGELRPLTGELHWGSNVQTAYYDQEQRDLTPSNTVLEEVWSHFPDLEEVKIRSVLGQFLFSGEDVLKKISTLSGGEKARVSLAKLMLQKANVLLMDEPTNHLDVYSKEALEQALTDYDGTLLFISHDRYFLNKMSDRILEMSNGRLKYFLGNFDDYVEKKKDLLEWRQINQPNEQEIEKETNSGALSYESQKQAKQEERNRQRKIEQLEQQIEQYETKISQVEEELTKPEIFQNYEALQEKNELINELKQQLEQCYEEWEALM